jgi:hypothetical protein
MTLKNKFLLFFYAISSCVFLQGIFFLLDRPLSVFDITAITLAGIYLFFFIRFLQNDRILFLLISLGLYFLQLAMFSIHLFSAELSPAPRFLLVLLIALHFAIVITAVLSLLLRHIQPARIAIFTFLAAAVFTIWEAALGFSAAGRYPGVELSFLMDQRPDTGLVYHPYSMGKIFYPGNPRGYFKEEDIESKKWWFRVAGDNIADLTSGQKPDHLRIVIRKSGTSEVHDIQLNRRNFKVVANRRYRIRFRAKADKPRKIILAFGQAHPPWKGLGLYIPLALRSEWSSYQQDFESTATDDKTLVSFNLGGSNISVDLDSVSLVEADGEAAVQPVGTPNRFAVNYRFDSMGCRGKDYATPQNTVRILVLGGSFTFGMGVHEEDTYAKRLEILLNRKRSQTEAAKTYEVINCGTGEYVEVQNKEFYKRVSSHYQPDVVLQVISPLFYRKDWQEETQAKLPQILYTFAPASDVLPERATPFLPPLEEILELYEETRKGNSQMVLFVFRPDADYEGKTHIGRLWNEFVDEMTTGVRDTTIPVGVLGKDIYSRNRYEDLVVFRNIDENPNERVHASIAQEVFEFLKK